MHYHPGAFSKALLRVHIHFLILVFNSIQENSKLFIQKNIHSNEKWIIAQGYAVLATLIKCHSTCLANTNEQLLFENLIFLWKYIFRGRSAERRWLQLQFVHKHLVFQTRAAKFMFRQLAVSALSEACISRE